MTCTPDGEGTAVTYRCDETVTFRDLTPGTLYHISVNATDWHYVKGTRGGTAETSAITEILSLTAEDLQNGLRPGHFPGQWSGAGNLDPPVQQQLDGGYNL